MRGLGAVMAGGLIVSRIRQEPTFAEIYAEAADDPGEQSVLLLEELGRLAEDHNGNCSTLRETVRDFQHEYQDEFDRLRADEKTWSRERLIEHAAIYGERRLAVVDKVTASLDQCTARTEGVDLGLTSMTALPSFGLEDPALAGLNQTATRRFSQADTSCTPDNHNFLVEAYCARHDSDWTSPTFQWPAYCSSFDIDGSCDLCAENTAGTLSTTDFCTHYWPQDCYDSNGQNVCHVDYYQTHGGSAGAICDQHHGDYLQTAPARCYSRTSDWSSPEFTWDLYCPKGYVDHDCIDCIHTSWGSQPEVCVEYWPQDCQTSDGNNCYVGFHVNETELCCHQNCPVGSSDCTISAFAAFFGSYECGACMLSWCGPMSNCLEHCNSEGCCDSDCSTDPVPPPPDPPAVVPHGTPIHFATPVPATPTPAGTPVPIGTPTPVGTPTSVPVTPTVPPATPNVTPFVPTVPPDDVTPTPDPPYATPLVDRGGAR